MSSTANLTIGQVAAAAGVTRKAVRVYEAKGLLSHSSRTTAGYRLYDQRDAELLTFIRQARALGLPLTDIRKILSIRDGGTPPCDAVQGMLDDRISDIDTTIADLRALRRSLVSTRRDAEDCCTETTSATICRAIEDGGPGVSVRRRRAARR